MNCNCTATNVILGLLVLVFTFWQTVASKWIVVIAAVLLILHAFCCGKCMSCETEKPAKSKKR